MGKTWRMTIQDKRVFVGTLACMDKEKNIILVNTDEYRNGDASNGRYVAMIMIPWRWVVKAEVEWTAYTQIGESTEIADSFYT